MEDYWAAYVFRGWGLGSVKVDVAVVEDVVVGGCSGGIGFRGGGGCVGVVVDVVVVMDAVVVVVMNVGVVGPYELIHRED